MEVNGRTSSTPNSSRIPRLMRSASFHGRAGHKKETVDEDSIEAQDDVGSLSSVCSIVSCAAPGSAYRRAIDSACDFRSRKSSTTKYALHCSTPTTSAGHDYLTPTQRANRTIRQLKALLKEAEAECNFKDFEIQRLTRELVATRMENAQRYGSNRDGGATGTGADAVVNGAAPSLSDSGLFDDLNHVNHSKESLVGCEKDGDVPMDKRKITTAHLEQVEELKRQHATEIQNIRARFTDRLESALSQLGDSNTRYANLLSSYDANRDELKRSETELIRLRQKISGLEMTVSQLQSDVESRETLEYESRENEFVQIEKLNQELADKSQLISQLESKLDELSSSASAHDASFSSRKVIVEDDKNTRQLEAVAAMLEKQMQVIDNAAVAWISGDDAVTLWCRLRRNWRTVAQTSKTPATN